MKNYKTEQEKFWEGEFGNEYIERNCNVDLMASKIAMFSKIVQRGGAIDSCLEMGCNVGLNLRALQILLPKINLAGVEINKKAAEKCAKLDNSQIYNDSILEFKSNKKWDLTFTSGVLIHISPDFLHDVYSKLYDYSNRYILMCEYYNPTPVEVNYRGNNDKLFKRDFAGEMMEKYNDLFLVDYGFIYHRDNNFPGDDLTWFLLEKK